MSGKPITEKLQWLQRQMVSGELSPHEVEREFVKLKLQDRPIVMFNQDTAQLDHPEFNFSSRAFTSGRLRRIASVPVGEIGTMHTAVVDDFRGREFGFTSTSIDEKVILDVEESALHLPVVVELREFFADREHFNFSGLARILAKTPADNFNLTLVAAYMNALMPPHTLASNIFKTLPIYCEPPGISREAHREIGISHIRPVFPIGHPISERFRFVLTREPRGTRTLAFLDSPTTSHAVDNYIRGFTLPAAIPSADC